jgi:predicted ATP-grasp superfamily ATP-dependent carboligase
MLSDDGRFKYLTSTLPLAPDLTRRAERLALRAIDSLHEPRGYLGVDLVLGDGAHGADDYVIEINPRLTTSYVILRTATRENLAQAMLTIISGDP